MRSIRITLCFTVLLMMAGRLFAQAGATGTILGTVTDSSGAIVPNAKVTVTNTATNVAFRTVTSSAGDYYAPSLNPGHIQGHRRIRRVLRSPSPAAFTLTVDQKVRVDVALKPGAVTRNARSDGAGRRPSTPTAPRSLNLSASSRSKNFR